MTQTSTALKKPDLLEVKQIQLTSNYIHIGSEVSKLIPIEYVATPSRVYLPDRDALAQALREEGKLQEYINRIEQRVEITTLLRDTFGDRWYETETDDDKPIFPEYRSSRCWTEQKITDLRPMIRNGFGQLYIMDHQLRGYKNSDRLLPLKTR